MIFFCLYFHILEEKVETIIDQTETNLVTLRAKVRLIMESGTNFDGCAHELVQINVRPGVEV